MLLCSRLDLLHKQDRGAVLLNHVQRNSIYRLPTDYELRCYVPICPSLHISSATLYTAFCASVKIWYNQYSRCGSDLVRASAPPRENSPRSSTDATQPHAPAN